MCGLIFICPTLYSRSTCISTLKYVLFFSILTLLSSHVFLFLLYSSFCPLSLYSYFFSFFLFFSFLLFLLFLPSPCVWSMGKSSATGCSGKLFCLHVWCTQNSFLICFHHCNLQRHTQANINACTHAHAQGKTAYYTG